MYRSNFCPDRRESNRYGLGSEEQKQRRNYFRWFKRPFWYPSDHFRGKRLRNRKLWESWEIKKWVRYCSRRPCRGTFRRCKWKPGYRCHRSKSRVLTYPGWVWDSSFPNWRKEQDKRRSASGIPFPGSSPSWHPEKPDAAQPRCYSDPCIPGRRRIFRDRNSNSDQEYTRRRKRLPGTKPCTSRFFLRTATVSTAV